MQSVTQGLSVTYEAKAPSVAEARTALAEYAAQAGASVAQIDSVRLAVSEMVTNAVVHAYRGQDGQIQVTAAVADGELWILVCDDGGGMQPQADRPGLGLGLALISRVCDEMSIVPRACGGIEVRILFKLEVPPSPMTADPLGAPALAETAVGALRPLSVAPAAPLPD
jgi:anti-sigma regulatory factor (Ser/Thr protein kinase)